MTTQKVALNSSWRRLIKLYLGMTWVFYALGLIVFSVITYLGVRLAKELVIPLILRNLAMFAIPAVLFLGVNLVRGYSFTLSPLQIGLVLLGSVAFSWLGNMASFKALELAPNQGYSLIISKSYVVMTSIVSVWLFQAPLSFKSVIAILIIIGFSALIMVEKKMISVTNPSKSWLWLTFGAFFAWGFLALSNRQLLLTGLQPTVLLFYNFMIVTVLIAIQAFSQKVSLKLPRKSWITILIIGVGGAAFNFFQVAGYGIAPNPGYMNAANAGSISLLTLVSAYLFKDELDKRKLAGVIGVAAGLVLLFL